MNSKHSKSLLTTEHAPLQYVFVKAGTFPCIILGPPTNGTELCSISYSYGQQGGNSINIQVISKEALLKGIPNIIAMNMIGYDEDFTLQSTYTLIKHT